MSGISSLGVGSGLELGALVQGLVNAERAPVENRLNRTQGQTQAQLSAVGSLAAVVDGLQSAVAGLKDFRTPLTVSSAGADSVSAVLTSAKAAEPGSYSVRVHGLASAHSLASAPFASADEVLGSGTLQLSVGDRQASIEVGGSVKTLRQVRDAINGSDVGIQAVLVQDGDGQRLLLSSRSVGAAGAMDVRVDGAVDPRLGADAMSETVPARDAEFSVNGLTLTAPSNQVAGVIPGVTLTLRKDGEAATTTVTIGQDRSAVRTRLNALADAFNAVQGRLKATASYNADTGQGGPLLGDASVRGLQARLSGVFSQTLPGAAGGSLLDLGFSVGVDGRVSFDAARLNDTLAADPAAVETRLAAFAELAQGRLQNYAGAGGILQVRVEGLTNRLKQIADQRVALDQRMEQVERRLRAQFSALDSMVAQFQNTSRYLTDQLAALGNLRPGRN